MANAARRRAPAGGPTTIRVGPWKRVYDTQDPYDDDPSELVDALNGYIPDPVHGSGFYARPGLVLQNSTAQLGSGGVFYGQGVVTHTGLDGTTTNFAVVGGKLWRADVTLSIYTDVTPVGITIDASRSTRVYGTTLADYLIFTDGVNKPWAATNLSGSPITGTYLQWNAANDSWSAFGPAVVYGGAMFFILSQLAGSYARTTIAWSEPGDPTTGYRQGAGATLLDNTWTLEQTGTTPLYALAGTNVALYYWREGSIGAIQGVVGPNLSSTATHDAISINIGSQMPAGIQQFGTTIFFPDQFGRPWMFQAGNAPADIWKQMRADVDASSQNYPAITQVTTVAAIEPTLNLYVLANWSPNPSVTASPTTLYVFDARTGSYFGRWTIAPGISVDSLGVFTDNVGRAVLVVLGSKTVGGAGGYVWTLNSLVGFVDYLATEGLVTLTTEDGVVLTTEGQSAVWQDNGVVPTISVTTSRLGYAPDTVWNFDTVTAITGSSAACAVDVMTTAVANTLECTPTPATSQDGTYRLFGGLDAIQGRGCQVTLSPTTAASQWNAQSVSVRAVPSLAGPEEP